MKISQPRLAALVSLSLVLGTSCNASAGGTEAPFSLSRNAQGVALIHASTLTGAAAGLGFAYAQDNFCLLQDYLMTVNGERSRHLGPDARVPMQIDRASTVNLASDIFYRFYVDGARADQLYAGADQSTRELIAGYVSGVNRYLSQTGVNAIDPACRGKSWVRPMTTADMHKILLDKTVLASGANFIEAFAGATPPGAGALAPAFSKSAAQPELDLEHLRRASRPELPLASNAWAFGRDTTLGRGSLLVGNPHFPWTGSNRFYQARMTVPGVLDVSGVALGGVPIIQIGFNKRLSWTHTVSAARRFTFFELDLKPGDPLTYYVDGAEQRMEAVDVNVPVLVIGALGNVNRRLYRTAFGPVLVIPGAGLSWSSAHAYAFGDVNIGNNRIVRSWLDIGRASTVRQARDALARNIGIPWVNTVAADSTGEVMYADLTPMPNVDQAHIARCLPSPGAAALLRVADLLVLRGSSSDCAWKHDSSAAAPGIVPAAQLPVAIRTDYVANSNDSYWLANPAIAWSGITPMAGPVGVPQRLRTRATLTMIERRLAGSDGLPGRQFSAAHLQKLLFNSDNFAANMVLDDLLALRGSYQAVTMPDGTEVALGEAWDALSRWDRRSATSSRGAHLFREFWRSARLIPNLHRIAFTPRDPIHTPAGLNTDDVAVRSALLQALGRALTMFRAAGVPPNAQLGAMQYMLSSTRKFAVPGGEEFEGVLNKLESRPFTDGHYQPYFGVSYVQFISHHPHGLSAEGILSYSQSTDPRSPYYLNQLPAFSRGEVFRLPEPEQRGLWLHK
ncbi:penicillin acylase family protein [Massilia sp. TWP1-3-3]|uniref:penicillin acylase family protein n=1 Tax=Massilia sp. TWP1-3-3 TaxID=2804573 RepID=UPI003CF0C8C9